ncbi:hypothetical protein JX265_010485 [Neoarthrinium moseri]|uniref:Luciferase domain-containing protein n=1 Tax=Neoarthrinium moseri TaxID=1658444 RepID=A0A9P9WEP7_9PEZI|nr:uncharacterized protein JN550_006254 [Neoarthrinium moseri]KAI1845599.1 hypothetical protein JX266_008210 [Neoarthrinium moseri]KAI1859482.1 hypothetical protein JX265_010485 [Neoarthrinium moseri]KAI1868679.1 hypothetical protein JN550_006254 [Neoarthrinium moseri]
MSTSQTQTQPTPMTSVVETSSDNDGLTIRVALRQDPMSITLDGPAIFTLATSLILTVHFFQPSIVALLVGVAPILLYIQNDYYNFLKLGPGGTPATVQGYLRINWFKIWALRDPFEPPRPDPTSKPSWGILSSNPLPYRGGPRPTVAGIAPQRQVDQHGSRECYVALRKILEAHGSRHGEDIGIGTSCFEKHGLGLFARFPVNNTCQGEICHVHNSDHSMHMNLHPDDVKEVLAKGWGQRHPLAWQGWLMRMPVPSQFVMVYAPRTLDEVRVVCRIIEAAGWWVMAKREDIDTLGMA